VLLIGCELKITKQKVKRDCELASQLSDNTSRIVSDRQHYISQSVRTVTQTTMRRSKEQKYHLRLPELSLQSFSCSGWRSTGNCHCGVIMRRAGESG